MGGKAFEAKTRRINRLEIVPTLEWLQDKWPSWEKGGKPLKELLLGSSGKKETSGDLDLNIDETIWDLNEVADELVQFLGEENVRPRPGNNQIFTAVPIAGRSENGFVQVDFMFGNFAWQEFSYFSPAEAIHIPLEEGLYLLPGTSQYKGLYRTELIKAVVAFNSDWVLENNGEMVARVGPTFFHDRGLVWRYRYRPYKRNSSSERVKALKEVSEEEFLKEFPSASTAGADIMKDPEKVVHFILNDNFTISDCASFETLWDSIHLVYSQSQISKIVQIYLERLNSLKVELPDGIRDMIKSYL